MAVKIFDYNCDKANEYVNALNDCHGDDSLVTTTLYYLNIITALRNNMTEVHASKTGTTYTSEENFITLAVADGSKDTVVYNLDYRKMKQHIEFYCDKTKHLIRMLPSPFRDGNAVISLYVNSGPFDKRIRRDTVLKYEIVAKLDQVMHDTLMASVLYHFLVDPESEFMDNNQLSDRTRLTKNYH